MRMCRAGSWRPACECSGKTGRCPVMLGPPCLRATPGLPLRMQAPAAPSQPPAATSSVVPDCLRCRSVHARFYQGQAGQGSSVHDSAGINSQADLPLAERDVRCVLRDERACVLRGCAIVFSRCWAMGQVAHEQPLWQMAEALGAECSTSYHPGHTTHVVAAHPGTDKVRAGTGRARGVHGACGRAGSAACTLACQGRSWDATSAASGA